MVRHARWHATSRLEVPARSQVVMDFERKITKLEVPSAVREVFAKNHKVWLVKLKFWFESAKCPRLVLRVRDALMTDFRVMMCVDFSPDS